MDDDNPSPAFGNSLFNPFGLAPRTLVLYHVLLICLSIFTLDRIAAHAFLPEPDSREIVLVGSTTCPHSRAVKERLVAGRVPFREVTIESQPFSRALASWAFQSLRVPIVVVGPEVIHGNRSDEIDEALATLGYERLEVAASPSAL